MMDGEQEQTEPVVEQVEEAPARDFEAEARATGWKPQDEFKGDSAKWKPAEDFLKARDDHLGMLRENNEKLNRKVRDLEKRSARAEREGFTRAMEMVAAKQRAAVEVGDVDAFDKAEAERIKLERQQAEPQDEEERREKFIEWRSENEWYGNNSLLTDYANLEAEKIAKTKGTHLDDDDLAEVAKRTKDRFGAKHPEAFGIKVEEKEDTKPRRSPVEGAPMNRGKSGAKTAADLDARGQALAQQMVNMGLFKNVEEYAKELYK